MFTVTDRRLEMARAVLSKFDHQLREHGQFQPMSLESELRDVWHTGYQEIKSAMVQLYQHGPFSQLAEYFMRNSNGGMLVSEFNAVLSPRIPRA